MNSVTSDRAGGGIGEEDNIDTTQLPFTYSLKLHLQLQLIDKEWSVLVVSYPESKTVSPYEKLKWQCFYFIGVENMSRTFTECMFFINCLKNNVT
jgi:hypothetical protein